MRLVPTYVSRFATASRMDLEAFLHLHESVVMSSIAEAVCKVVEAANKSNQVRTTALTAASSVAESVGEGLAEGDEDGERDGRATGLSPELHAAKPSAESAQASATRQPRTNTAKG